MDLQQRLRENINTFLKSANLVYDTKDYTSACKEVKKNVEKLVERSKAE